MMFLLTIAAAAYAIDECEGNSVSLLTLKTEMKQHTMSGAALRAWSSREHIASMTEAVEHHQREQNEWAKKHHDAKAALKAMTVNSKGVQSTVKGACAEYCSAIPAATRCVVPDCAGCDICSVDEAVESETPETPATPATPEPIKTYHEGDAATEIMAEGHADDFHEDLHAQNADDSSHGEWIKQLRAAPTNEHLRDREHDINAFVQQQKQSSDACSAKTLEAKRSLDGIASKVLLLSDEIEAQEAIHEGGASTIDEMLGNSKKSKEILDEDKQHCNTQYDECWDALDTHRLEIVELHQMANPELRSVISHGGLDHKVDYAKESKEYALEVVNHYLNLYKTADLTHIEEEYKKNMSSFLQTQSCEQIAESTKKVSVLAGHVRKGKQPDASVPADFEGLDCDQQRVKLQEVYESAFFEILQILTNEEVLCEEEKSNCAGHATGKDQGNQASYQSLIAEATRNIQTAKDVIATVLPLLDNSKKEFDILTAHIKDLEDNCEVDHDVTEHMERIRGLIKSLEKCPGRNDFTLTLPDVSDIGLAE